MTALRRYIAGCRRFGELRAAGAARIDLFAFQLEPALAVVRGLATRLLIADEVGLGKTIQAGLVIAELQERGWCDRALVLTPAGLREQWADELARRFGLRAVILDADTLRAFTAGLPTAINPWSMHDVVLASFDFVKQPEVLEPAASVLWDLLVVDEAHQVAAAPARVEAVRMLGERARHVVLLSASPHSGDDRAYTSLCEIGRLHRDDEIVLFRRTRAAVGFELKRRVHLLSVRLTNDEMRMHHLLGVYAGRVWRIGARRRNAELRLVAIILSKRALSSATALRLSVERRLSLLGGSDVYPHQNSLPFDVTDDAPSLGTPAFERPDDESAALTEILTVATRASADERKLAALRRILRRANEPAVVFTEYRDALNMLETSLGDLRSISLLHGGLDRHQRAEAVSSFNAGRTDLLLATDAGAEGLNLHHRCRLVINLELPWSPTRLEQRIGRVDRLGQLRTVHAIHLLARDTNEQIVLARLLRRVDRIRRALPSFHDPLSSRSEMRIAAEIFDDPDP
jgi:SNF2 family DNA or RNA helicase